MIKALDISKAHGHDGISVNMIKICAGSIAHPLTLIFQNSLAAGIFANNWKKANIVPIHKKSDKQIVSNYIPVSLLPISSKIFEKLNFNELSPFLRRETCYLNINLVFGLVILVFTSYLQLHMTFFLVLTLPLSGNLWGILRHIKSFQ